MSKAKCSSNSQNILLYFSPGLGNAVLLMPMLRGIRKHEPASRIEMVITQQVVRELLVPEKLVDEFVFYDNRRKLGWLHYRMSQAKLISQLRNHNYKYLFLCEKLNSQLAFFAAFVRSGIKIGYQSDKWFDRVLNISIPLNNQLSEVEQRLDLLRALEWDVQLAPPEIRLLKEEKKIQDFLSDESATEQINVGIHPGSSEALSFKRWPIKRFSELVDSLCDKYNIRLILFGGPDEREIGEAIKGNLKKVKAKSLIGKTNIRQTAACIAACDYFISNDSGLMHIAAAVRTPQIALFGPTCAIKNVPQSPCAIVIDGNKVGGDNDNPIHNIQVEHVLEAFEKLKKRYSRTR